MIKRNIYKAVLFISLQGVCTPLFAQPADKYNRQVDSLEQVIATENLSEEELLSIYKDISRMSEYIPDRAAQYMKKGIALADKTNNDSMLSDLYVSAAYIYRTLNEPDSALMYCEKIIDLHSSSDMDSKQQALTIAYTVAGDVLSTQGQNEQALEYLYKAIEIGEKTDDKKLLIQTYMSMAYLYAVANNTELAEEYFVKLGEVALEAGDSLSLGFSRYQLSNICSRTYKFDKALEFAQDAYRIIKATHNVAEHPDYLIEATITLSDTWKHYDHQKVLEYANEALSLAEQYNMDYYKSRILYSLATAYYYVENYKDAEKFALQAMDEAEVQGDEDLKNFLYDLLSLTYINLEQKDKALEYHELYRKWMTNFFQQTFDTSLSEMEVKYETEKKETQIATLERQNQLFTWLGIVAGTAFLLALTALLFMWRWTIQKRRIVATKALLDGELAERTRLAKDLHDGLGGMLTGIKLSLENMQNEDTSDFTICFNLLNDSVKELRRISHHLMPDALQNEGLKAALISFCRNFPNVQFGYLGSDERVEPQMEIAIYRIIYELVNNALKHSKASEILVQVMRETDYIALTVRDNGRGFDTSAISEGMGLRNIKDRVTSSGGRILIDSRIGEGTEININFTIK